MYSNNNGYPVTQAPYGSLNNYGNGRNSEQAPSSAADDETHPYYGHLSPLRHRFLYSQKELDDIVQSTYAASDNNYKAAVTTNNQFQNSPNSANTSNYSSNYSNTTTALNTTRPPLNSTGSRAPLMVKAYAAYSPTEPLKPYTFERRAVRDDDVQIEIDYAGICHSDIHTVRGDWGPAKYPVVPGHEIAGHVTAVGPKVTKLKVGDLAGVGCMVDSCRTCKSCQKDEENYCLEGLTLTYNSAERDSPETPTQGGYSQAIVVREHFVVKIPWTLGGALAAVPPLLCAGITTYSPLRYGGVKAGDKVGVVGLGGLGHMGVKLAKAMGASVTMISTSDSKKRDAASLGATGFINSKSEEQMNAAKGTFDFILDTISAKHDFNMYLALLGVDGKMCLVGGVAEPSDIYSFSLLGQRKTIFGSAIGGMKETQELVDFCAQHGIVADIELIDPSYINEAYDRTVKSDVRYRFVINNKKL